MPNTNHTLNKTIGCLADDTNRCATLVLVVLVLGHIAMVGEQPLLPFVDLPVHLATAKFHRMWRESPETFDDRLEIDLRARPTVFHVRVLSSELFSDPEQAARWYCAFYIGLFGVALLVNVHTLNGNRSVAILGLVYAYHVSFCYGFMAYSMSIPLLLLLHAAVVSTIAEGCPTVRAALIALVLMGLYFVHLIALGFALLYVFVSTCANYRVRDRAFFANLVALIPSSMMLANWYVASGESRMEVFRERGNQSFLFDSAILDYAIRPLRLFFVDLAETIPLTWQMVFVGITFAALLLLRAHTSDAKERREESDRRGFDMLVPCAALCYFATPHVTASEVWLSPRFSVVLVLSLLFRASASMPTRGRRAWVGLALASVVAVTHLHQIHRYFGDFRDMTRDFTREIFPQMGGGDLLMYHSFAPRLRLYPVLQHFGDYYTIWTGGTSASLVLDAFEGTVRKRVPNSIPRRLGTNDSYILELPGGDVRYVLFHGEMDASRVVGLEMYRRIKSSGAWSLFQFEGNQGADGISVREVR